MNGEDYMLPCLNKKMLGIDCFGCGAQRAFWMITEGKFREAFDMFPAIYTVLIFLVLGIVTIIDRKRNYGPFLIGLAILNAVVIVVSYFYKHF